jgi:PilZ domain-containing protein
MFRRRRLRERRSARRFEIVGQLWGTLEWSERWPLRNIGHGGMLVEGRRPLPIDELHGLSLSPSSPTAAIRARVCHSSRVEGDEAARPYLIGFEFVDLERDGADQIDALIAAVAAEREA